MKFFEIKELKKEATIEAVEDIKKIYAKNPEMIEKIEKIVLKI